MRGRRLILVPYDDGRVPADFAYLATRVEELAPDLRARSVADRPHRLRRVAWAARPTLVVSALPLRRFRPLRGAVTQGRSIPKSRQLERLQAAGIPCPRSRVLREGERFDPEGFGPYVVTKPDLGRRGAHVRVERRDRVRWRDRPSPVDGANTDLLVQELVWTGRWPVTWRVQTLFGEPLYALRAEGNHARRPLDGPGGAGGGVSIVGSARDATWSVSDDPAMLALARRAAACYPDIPLLGIDLVRDAASGRIHVLELNPVGCTWHLGAEAGLALQREHGFDLAAPLDAYGTAARVLVEQTRARAR